MVRARLACSRTRINRLKSHQPPDPFMIDYISHGPQPGRHLRHSVKWHLCKLLINQSHQHQIVGIVPLGGVIKGRARDPQEFALP